MQLELFKTNTYVSIDIVLEGKQLRYIIIIHNYIYIIIINYAQLVFLSFLCSHPRKLSIEI